MQIETQIILLLSVAAIIAILARRARVPYTIAMVLTGVAASIFVAPLMDHRWNDLPTAFGIHPT